MPRTAHIENAIDRAKNRLAVYSAAEGEAQDAIRAAVDKLKAAIGASDKDARHVIECIEEQLAELVDGASDSIKRDISQLEDDLNTIEWEDLERSAPVTL